MAAEIRREGGDCKHCGRQLFLIYYDDKTFESLHEYPACEEYERIIATAKMPPAEEVVLVDSAGQIHRKPEGKPS
jgi:hypothetical protein